MKNIFTLCSVILLLSACASKIPADHPNHPVGDVRAVNLNKEAVVCMMGSQVSAGQKVSVYESVCKRGYYQTRWATKPKVNCEEVKRGEAEVLSSSDIHSVILKPVGSLSLQTSYIVKNE